jgi:glutaminyl-peptide cyclotransferase
LCLALLALPSQEGLEGRRQLQAKPARPSALELLARRHPVLAALDGCPAANAPMFRPVPVRSFAHDSDSFLQGLAFHDHVLYEAAGLYRRSSLRIVDPRNGSVVRMNHLRGTAPSGSLPGAALRLPAQKYFAEGVTHWRGKLLMLTWREGSLLEYDAASLSLVAEHPQFAQQLARREGWGITNDATQLYVTDGSSTIYLIDPATLRVRERIPVVARPPALRIRTKRVPSRPAPISMLNELEMLPNGMLLFNIWLSDYIGIFDVRRRCVLGWINGTGLDAPFSRRRRMGACLNGIAFDETDGAILISGKLWPIMHEIRLEAQ